MSIRYSVLLALVCLAATAGSAHAKGQLTSVVPAQPLDDEACVHGPSGQTDHFWEVVAGKTYVCTLTGVTDCANGGTDPTIGIRVNATGPGFIDITAEKKAIGVYEFTIMIPDDNPSCTLPIFYCTPPGSSDPGLRVLRTDGQYPAHFRIATFDSNCENPTFPACETTPTRSRTWAQVKQFYR
jgi:hypothetical protein